MKLIQPSFSILEQESGIDGIYKQIELAGRTCYKSENKITDTSAKAFVDRLIASGHLAMLEHGTVYLTMVSWDQAKKYCENKYSTVCGCFDGNKRVIKNTCNMPQNLLREAAPFYVTTNMRVLIENGWMNDIWYLSDPTPLHSLRVTVLFHTQIAISREFNRHRANSMAESSTRYCNYSKDKFGNEITFNLPSWMNPESITPESINNAAIQYKLMMLANKWGNAHLQFPEEFTALDFWLLHHLISEYCYMGLIHSGWTAQQARTVLPLDTHTDLVHTAFVEDWKHFFDLRAFGTTGKPHPDASCLAIPLYNEFKKRSLL